MMLRFVKTTVNGQQTTDFGERFVKGHYFSILIMCPKYYT